MPASAHNIRKEAAAVRMRLHECQRKIPVPHAEFSAIARRCSYLESVMDDVENDRISGPDHALAGLVATGRELCDFLDALDGKNISDGPGTRQ